MLTREEQQDIVEFCVLHIVEQGGPAWDHSSMCECEYINRCGQRCIIGAMLSDEQVKEAMGLSLNGADQMSPREMCKKGWNGWDPYDSDFLTSLQCVHDNSADESHGKVFDGATHEDEFFRCFSYNIKDFCEEWHLRFPEEYI